MINGLEHNVPYDERLRILILYSHENTRSSRRSVQDIHCRKIKS